MNLTPYIQSFSEELYLVKRLSNGFYYSCDRTYQLWIEIVANNPDEGLFYTYGFKNEDVLPKLPFDDRYEILKFIRRNDNGIKTCDR